MKLIQQLQNLIEGKFDNIDAWMDGVKKAYPDIASKLEFKSRVENEKHLMFTEIPGEDRCYGVFNMDDEEGEVLKEQTASVLRLDPYSGEDRAKIVKACHDRGAVVISEKDKHDYIVIELPKEGLSTSALKSYARSLGAKFTEA